MKNKSYSSYREGLELGDIVYYRYRYGRLYGNTRRSLVLDREFLYKVDTVFGERKFFEYKFLSLEDNTILKEETKNFRVVKTIKLNKGNANENSNNR